MEWIGIAVVIVVVILLNGFIAEVEDDSPGGFNNPDGKWIDVIKKPKLHQIIIWAIGALVIAWLIFMFITKENI
jgi:hypothetical protein